MGWQDAPKVSGGSWKDAPQVQVKPNYAQTKSETGQDVIQFGNDAEPSYAPNGTAKFLSDIQNNDLFDSQPSSAFEETKATFEKQGAYIALVANAYGLVGDDEIADFVADRSKALSNAQSRQPEYMKRFNQEWEDSKGIFEGTGVILSNPQAIGRQIMTQAGNSVLPLAGTFVGSAAGGAAGSVVPIAGTAAGAVAGSMAGAFVGGSVTEIGAEIDGMIQEAGYDPSNADSVLLALQNDSLMESIKVKAQRKGLTTAGVDALFQVVGGRFLKAAKVRGAGKVATAGAAVADVGVQSVGEGVGEAAGQFAKDGKVDVKDAVLEAVTSLGQSVGQTAIGSTTDQVRAKSKVAIDVVNKKITDKKKAIQDGDVDIDTAFTELEALEAERNQISIDAENQIIEAESDVQTEFLVQAQDIKDGMETATDINVQDPVSIKKTLGYTPETITQFIKRTGGIKDTGGELRAKDITNKRLIGLITKENRVTKTNQGDMVQDAQIDAVKQRVFDEGYFPEKASFEEVSNDELFDAIENDLSGSRVYKSEDQSKINELTAGASVDQYMAQGIDPNMTVEEIADVLRVDSGLDLFVAREKVSTPQILKDGGVKKQVVEDIGEITERERSIFDAPIALGKGTLKGIEKFVTPVSTRIGNISEKLMFKLRRFEMDLATSIQSDEKQILPFLVKWKSMDKGDRLALDYALKNSQTDVINAIAKKYDMQDVMTDIRSMLDNTFNRSIDAGVDVRYKSDHFPRHVDDVDGYMDYLRNTEEWSVFNDAFKLREAKLERSLTINEKAEIASLIMRGIRVEGITLGKKGIFKGRTIDKIKKEANQFYSPSDQALIRYIVISNESIETSKFFGKGININETENMQENVGDLVANLIEEDNLTSKDARELKDVFNARFNRGRMGPVAETFKNLSYLATMGSNIGSTVTQIGDTFLAAYKNGLLNTATALPRAAINKTVVNTDDVGVTRIAQEFEGKTISSKAVEKSFQLTGLSTIDRIGKRTLLQSSYNKFKKMAKKGDKNLVNRLELMFEGDADQVMADIKDGVITDDVKFLLFNDLLDMQPIARSEMPEVYLRSGNGRYFYMLKSFTLKQLDIYRRDVFREISLGVKSGDKKRVVKAAGNFVRLLGYMTIAGASRDYIWSLLTGQEVDEPDDMVVKNMLKAFGLSKYTFDQMAKPYMADSPSDAFFGTVIIPPTKTIDNMWRDMQKLKSKKGLNFKDMRTLRSIPVGGELYYFWFGGGSESKKKATKSKRR